MGAFGFRPGGSLFAIATCGASSTCSACVLIAKCEVSSAVSALGPTVKCSQLYFTTTISSKLSKAYTLSGTVPKPSFRFQSIAIFELFPSSFLVCVSLALAHKTFFLM